MALPKSTSVDRKKPIAKREVKTTPSSPEMIVSGNEGSSNALPDISFVDSQEEHSFDDHEMNDLPDDNENAFSNDLNDDLDDSLDDEDLPAIPIPEISADEEDDLDIIPADLFNEDEEKGDEENDEFSEEENIFLEGEDVFVEKEEEGDANEEIEDQELEELNRYMMSIGYDPQEYGLYEENEEEEDEEEEDPNEEFIWEDATDASENDEDPFSSVISTPPISSKEIEDEVDESSEFDSSDFDELDEEGAFDDLNEDNSIDEEEFDSAPLSKSLSKKVNKDKDNEGEDKSSGGKKSRLKLPKSNGSTAIGFNKIFAIPVIGALLRFFWSLYRKITDIFLSILIWIFKVLSHLPVVGRFFSLGEGALSIIRKIAYAFPLLFLVGILFFINTQSVDSKVKSSLADEASVTLEDFDLKGDTASARVTNDSDVSAVFDVDLKTYSWQPSLNPISWVRHQESGTCSPVVVELAAGESTDITTKCKTPSGMFPRVTGEAKS